MKNRLLSSVAVTALASGFSVPVQAQAPAIHNWTGLYIGLNAGGAWGRSGAVTETDCSLNFPAAYFCGVGGGAPENGAAVTAAGTGTMTASGFTGGVQAGYNFQAKSIVYGVETDFGAFRLRGSRQGNGTYPTSFNQAAGDPFSVNSSFGTDWLWTFRGRIGGLLTPNLLAYATGGLALTRLTVANSFSDINSFAFPAGIATESGSTSKLKTGWVIGAGLEWALARNWTVKAEYLYVDFGMVTASGAISNDAVNPGYAQGLNSTADLTAQIARVGVNYKF